jgi:biopolymer transport protein ExbD
MAEKRRFFDVWIVESNTVYREVPFTVVADWVQQGRLLEDDMLKPSGTPEWQRLGGTPDFSVYLPKPQAFRSDDKAEALEPVELDFSYKRRHDEEDDDVDMIPLIDVSLVLLIFFMLISAGTAAASSVRVPDSKHPNVAINADEITVNIELDNGTPVFSLGIGNKPASDAKFKDIREYPRLLEALEEMLSGQGQSTVTINANPDVRSGLVRQLTADMSSGKLRPKVSRILIGVNEVQE